MRTLWLLTAALAALITVATATAHSEPNIVSPGDGAVLATPPAEIVMQMTEDMARTAGANNIVVLDATGKPVTTQSATIDNADRSKLTVPLPKNLPVGKYTIEWKTLSADDGDSASGTLHFTYDPSLSPTPGVTRLQPNIIDVTPTPTPAVSSTRAATVTPAAAGAGASSGAAGGGDGVTWILVAAVGAGMFALGGGSVFLFSRKAS